MADAIGKRSNDRQGNPMSEWRAIDGFLAYEVSDQGEVRRVIGGQGAVAGKVLRWHTNNSTGYPDVRLQRDSKAVTIKVHRLVARAFHGPRLDGLQIRHKDGNRMNARAENLAYGTHVENAADKVRHGTSLAGEKNPKAKLTATQAEAIRLDYGLGVSAKELSARYSLHESTVYRIVRGKYWRQEASNRRIDRAAA